MDMFNHTIEGGEFPKKVFVLTDLYCGSSGDGFVSIVKKSPKVTVIGRNTKGITDYSNCSSVVFDNKFFLGYSTSRFCGIDSGNGILGVGHAPHIYITWSSEHCYNDLDLEAVYKELEL